MRGQASGTVATYDVLIVGGGPAGSSCARTLTRAGAHVAVIDRARFPRVKLCAGWVSAPIWDALDLAPRAYPAGLWEWNTCHVHYRGTDHAVPCRGWFIRRYELDDFLLRTSGAELHLGESVKAIERDADGLWSTGEHRARHLVGAGGTHCPVARVLAPPRARGPVGVQELELENDAGAVARTRLGADGEPELLLFDDLRGYAWNVPKSAWLNVGAGTVDPTEVRDAWRAARTYFIAAGHVPDDAAPALDHVKGHSYYLFDPAHLAAAARIDPDGAGGLYLVGDALGLAQPLTAEGILPAVVSGRLCAEAILDGEPATYPARLAAHPVIADYARVFRLRETAAGLRRGAAPRRSAPRTGPARPPRDRARLCLDVLGCRLPAPRALDLVLAGARRWQHRKESHV